MEPRVAVGTGGWAITLPRRYPEEEGPPDSEGVVGRFQVDEEDVADDDGGGLDEVMRAELEEPLLWNDANAADIPLDCVGSSSPVEIEEGAIG